MNRTHTATHSYSRFDHPALDRPPTMVVDVSTLDDEFGISRKASTARFRGRGFESEVAPVSYSPVFTPHRQRVRMHRETMVALVGAASALILIIGSVCLIVAHKGGAANGSASPGMQRELRLFDHATTARRE